MSPAIAAFAAAGNDIDALEKAIEEAAYLDATPGEDRQKLRGNAARVSPRLSLALRACAWLRLSFHGFT